MKCLSSKKKRKKSPDYTTVGAISPWLTKDPVGDLAHKSRKNFMWMLLRSTSRRLGTGRRYLRGRDVLMFCDTHHLALATLQCNL